MAERELELALRPLITALIPFTRALPSWPNHLPKVSPHAITWGVRISAHAFGGTQTSSPYQLGTIKYVIKVNCICFFLPFKKLNNVCG